MSERMSAEIRIGGKIKSEDISDLLNAINSSGASREWGDEPVNIKTLQELLDCVSEQDGFLVLVDDMASWGEFRELENALCELKIPYDRLTDGNGVYGGEYIQYRPCSGTSDDIKGWVKGEDETRFVPVNCVVAAIEKLKKGDNEGALCVLQECCPDIEELPKFEVVS